MINALELYRNIKNEWDKTEQPLRERSSILPFGQYEDGSVGLAWPEILAAPAEGIANFGQYGYGEDAVPYNSRMAFDAAGGAMTGGLGVGLAGGMVDNAVGSAGGKLAQSASDLPMDLALERAQPQGIRAWHSSPYQFASTDGKPFGSFDDARFNTGVGDYEDNGRGIGHYLSSDRATSEFYKGFGTNNPAIRAARNALDWSRDDKELAISRLRQDKRADANMIEEAVELINRGAARGRTYEINIKANPEKFLKWEDLDEAGRKQVSDKNEVKKLVEQGIPGVTFVDPRTGALDYAVFDSEILEILNMYSNAPTGAAIPAGMEASDTDPALLEYLKLYGL